MLGKTVCVDKYQHCQNFYLSAVVNSGCCDGGLAHRDADLVKPASYVTGHE